ncbi:TRAP transporter permease [Garicola koreensis]|uniref:TRAP transporter 4TM/12TM fusion protein n=1 Tax=Garicola koreensis TaxID=1262554 RepID=A0A7W5XKT4_9MICC|nr:TRAP transporter permease [Garicola koreensis]MBB3667952.1 TRAP transporter 4TM/12TM fusion protein [Garicola koreensis]
MTRDKNTGDDVDPSSQTRAEARAAVIEQRTPATGEDTVTSSEAPEEERAAQQREAAEAAAKYDSESRVRETHWRPVGLLISAVAIILALYHMYTAYFGTPPTLIHRSLHVSVILFLVFMVYPPTRGAQSNGWRIADGALAVASLVPTIYMTLNYEEFVLQAGRFTSTDIVVASLLVVLVLEAARRVTGIALPILGILFIGFGLFGRDMPGLLRHRGYDWDTLAYQFYAGTEGIFGTAVGVAASYIILFILFGAFLAKSGMSQMFNDLAMAIAGQGRGGPAKVATIASGFMGSINGSAIANVVSTGAFTIPMMKKIGYTRTFSGAVESSASVGGQILPPIMGAAAFIMAETIGVPYTTVALAAIVPALLFYISLIVQIHLRATKLGLRGISRENLPAVMEVIKERGHLLLPLVFLVYMLFFSGRTILYSALLTILVTIVVAMLRKNSRMSFRDILDALEEGARSTLGVAVACASVGVIVGVVTISGFGVTLASAIVQLSGGILFWTLVLTMLACLVLGMGLPSIPAYIITATMAAPALTMLGVEPLVAHLFVFYFGLFANITPPVALAAFAAAGVSGAKPMATGVAAFRLAAAGFVVPYLFVYNPDLLLRGVGLVEAVTVVAAALVTILVISASLEGHFMEPISWYFRILLVGAGLLVYTFEIPWVGLGAAIILAVLAIQLGKAKKNNNLSYSAI